MAQVLKVAKEVWALDQSVAELERMSGEMSAKAEQAELEIKTREEANAKTVSMHSKFSKLQSSLLAREIALLKEYETKEVEALNEKTALTEDLKKRFDSLQPRSEAAVSKREKVDAEIDKLRGEALAIHKEIMDDQPEIDEGLAAMKSFKELNLNKSNGEAETEIKIESDDEKKGTEGVDDGNKETEEEGPKPRTFEQDAMDLGVTAEELEEFKLATEEYQTKQTEQGEREEAAKTALMKASDDMIATKKDFTEFTATLEGIAGRVQALETEARALEKDIHAAETRRDTISAKFSGEDAAIKEAMEESKKLDRLLEALQQKQKKEDASSELTEEEEATSENEPNATTT